MFTVPIVTSATYIYYLSISPCITNHAFTIPCDETVTLQRLPCSFIVEWWLLGLVSGDTLFLPGFLSEASFTHISKGGMWCPRCIVALICSYLLTISSHVWPTLHYEGLVIRGARSEYICPQMSGFTHTRGGMRLFWEESLLGSFIGYHLSAHMLFICPGIPIGSLVTFHPHWPIPTPPDQCPARLNTITAMFSVRRGERCVCYDSVQAIAVCETGDWSVRVTPICNHWHINSPRYCRLY